MDDKKTRTFIFIDGENIRNSVESYGYKDLDYEKLYSWFKEKKDATRIYIYVGIEDGDSVKGEKYNSLKTLGYTVSAKKVMLYKQKPLTLRSWSLSPSLIFIGHITSSNTGVNLSSSALIIGLYFSMIRIVS